MVGKVGPTPHVRRQVPAPPRRSDPPPPYSRHSTLTSAAPQTRTQWWRGLNPKKGWKRLVKSTNEWLSAYHPKKLWTEWKRLVKSTNEWLSAYHPKKLWTGFSKWITAMHHDFLALFKKKGSSVEKVKVLPGLKVGQQNYFTFEQCEHLVYLVTYNEDRKLELLGLRYLAEEEGGVVVIKQMEELSAPQLLIARRERAWIESEGEEGITPFKKMLQELLKWTRRQIKDVKIFRNLDASDVYFIADYDTTNFRFRHDAKVLESFITELDVLKSRLKALLWDGKKGHKKSFRLHRFSKQERADLARFRRMLSFLIIENEPIDGAALKVTQLYDYWVFWNKVEFLPQHQLAIDLDDVKIPDPELYQGMRVSIKIS